MKNVNRLQPLPSNLITYEGHALLVTDREACIRGGEHGFYYRQTRFLSKMQLMIDGKAPNIVSANPVDSYSSIAYWLAPSPAGAKAGPDPDSGEGGGEMVRHGIEVQMNCFVGGGLHCDVYVTNHALAQTNVELACAFDADFADQTEAQQGQRQQTAPIDRHWRLRESGGELVLDYLHPRLRHSTEIRFTGNGTWSGKGGAVCCTLDLPPQQTTSLSFDVAPVFCGERIPSQHEQDEFSTPAIRLAEPGLALPGGNGLVQRAWDRAIADLGSLALLEGDREERLTPAGGVPKYIALFGRDALVTALQASLAVPGMVRGTLRLVSQWNATEYNERFDEEPGRVVHQRQLSPLALLEKTPFLHYYGDYSAPALFLIGMAYDLALTGDAEFFLSMREKVLATLEWMDRDGDRDRDGLYEYETKAGSWGEKNQGWKDSREAILYEDGRLVKDPLTLIGIQGLFYAAKQLMGLAFTSVGEDRRGRQLLDEAKQLKRRFNEKFWIPEERYFGLALDPVKKLVRTVTEDAGQCLAHGIVDENKSEAVAIRLMQPELFSGWGVRTLSNRHPAFNPFAYHLGSVWPANNAVIGFGLKRYGFDRRLHELAKGLLDATELFDVERLPETMGGHARDRRHPHPGIYPQANSPQAWSASAVVSLIHSMLGLIPVAPRKTLIVNPDLPEWLPELTLSNVRIGKARVALRFRRDKAGHTEHELVEQEGELSIHRPAACDSGIDRVARSVREVVSR
jgi:glycogen debranching enzyme